MNNGKISDIVGDERAVRFPLGFPIGRQPWQDFDLAPVVGTADRFHTLRLLADRVNHRNGTPAKEALRPGELMSMALLQDAARYVVATYCEREHPGLMDRALNGVDAEHLEPVSDNARRGFETEYPDQSPDPSPDLAKNLTADRAAREMILLSLASENPALSAYRPLFDDTTLRSASPYPQLVVGLEAFFEKQPPMENLGGTLFRVLRAPMEASPNSLSDQLDYVLERWIEVLPPTMRLRALTARDVIREETRMRGLGPGPLQVMSFVPGGTAPDGTPIVAEASIQFAPSVADEVERFTPDRDWMSNVVLMAKLVHVWLSQLSTRHDRPIERLDEVPDEELDRLARWGFTSLWLIGVWERSQASQEIKRRMGNPEAMASAYSLYDYTIAEKLGGEAAYQKLRDRAWARGIRLAADMVPNHFGLHSRWVLEHPDRFLQTTEPPYPGYTFTGPDLSLSPDIGVHLEDGYWNHADAAVVFKHEDRRSGQVRYIYHGNDGTQMPWNDTAQLDYLNPEVREAIIQTILDVARRFPVIRFDAAMTLARKHIQRLWFPPPGEGGAIPSRSERGLSRADFDAQMPKEFWREVVDRIQEEAPDTLLLAEAFWLMEGYFVRTLGMHRVYNSAFMNMLKMEDNAKYRQTVKNVLEFSPAVLQRFVVFTSNPDEQTSIDQFGKGDKYFGVAVLMVTMPGLPMFAHGQIEAFTEKYGMEYARAYRDESIDADCVARHEAEIFPLMRRRYLFSQVEHFALYDFERSDGSVDENVFAYSNRARGERALIVYNNAYDSAEGRLRRAAPVNVGPADKARFVTRDLLSALDLRADDRALYAFREHCTGLCYLRRGKDLVDQGWYESLQGYQTRIYLDFREIANADESWIQLAERLGNQGVPDLEAARRNLQLEPIHQTFRTLVEHIDDDSPAAVVALRAFLDAADVTPRLPVVEALVTTRDIRRRLAELCAEPPSVGVEDEPAEPADAADPAEPVEIGEIGEIGETNLVDDLVPERAQRIGMMLAVLRALPADGLERWGLGEVIAALLDRPGEAQMVVSFARPTIARIAGDLTALIEAQPELLGVNVHNEIEWFNRERMLTLLEGHALNKVYTALACQTPPTREDLLALRNEAERLRKAVDASGYRLQALLKLIAPKTVAAEETV